MTISSGPVSDVAGNQNPGITTAATYDVDLSNPYNVSFVGGPAANSSHYFGSVPANLTCTADDDISGLDSCVVTGYSTAVGTHAMTATATDEAGRTATASRTYTVLAWTLNGFYSPVDMNEALNRVKAGSTVPLAKFRDLRPDRRSSRRPTRLPASRSVRCPAGPSIPRLLMTSKRTRPVRRSCATTAPAASSSRTGRFPRRQLRRQRDRATR